MGLLTKSYNNSTSAKTRRFDSPIKLRHIWIPLGFLLYCIYNNQRIAELSLAEASVGFGLSMLSFLPLFIWASSTERELPAFQSFCAVHFPYYAYPILICKGAYMDYKESDRLAAGTATLVFLAITIWIYYVGRNRFGARRPASVIQYREISEDKGRLFFSLLLMIWCGFIISRSFGLIRFGNATNVVWSITSGGGMVAVWCLMRQMGEKKLTGAHTAFILGCIGLGLFISFATGSLVGGLVMLIVAVVALSLGKSRIPWPAILLGLAIVSFLQLGKAEMRRAHWHHGSPVLTIEKICSIYESWIPASWDMLIHGKRHSSDNQSLLDRANLIHMQALVMQQTPARLPFLWGKTYLDIPICLVPRLLWPNKPHGHISTETLGLYYGITNRTQLRTTTIGLGLLSEAWANFGWGGIIGLALLIGTAMRYVANGCVNAHPSSVHRLLSIVWVAQSFQIEQAMSSWLSSFLQAVLAIAFIVYPFTHTARLEKNLTAEPSYSAA